MSTETVVAAEPATTTSPADGGRFRHALKSVGSFEITRRKVRRKDLMHFSRQLAVFVRAGIPLTEALEVITEEMGSKFFKKIVLDVDESLKQGETFSAAMAKHEKALPPYYIGILRAAETTGSLDTALQQLSEYIERDMEARRKLISALMYPCVIMGVAIVAVVVLTVYVLPKFATFFAGFHARLPLPTRMLIAIAHFFSHRWYVVVAVLAFLLVCGVFLQTTPTGRRLRDRLVLKVPALGDLIRHAILERFCRMFGAMVTAGVPLPEAMAITADAVTNTTYRQGLQEARLAMLRGEGLAAPLSRSKLFPASARQMLRVGEDTGTLDQQLETAATYFDRELDYRIKAFTSLFEPAVIITVGVVVGFVAIALISALYGIYRQVH
jgi:type IV pilus assembly protein PilC